MKNKKGFTLIELLVVVLIIGILAAIAVPQYQKAVLKADLHRGISLVNSLYQAQQSYYLANGNYTWDIDELDVSFPKDSSCVKGAFTNTSSWYDCDFGRVYNSKTAVQFQDRPYREGLSKANIAYSYQLQDEGLLQAGKIYCYARSYDQKTQDACINMGGTFLQESGPWFHYQIN